MPKVLPEVALILIGCTIIILLLAGLIVLSLFINQKRKFRFRQQTLEMKNNFDQELLRSQLEIQTQAFESISRELHDNVGTLISIAMVHIGSVNEHLSQKEKEKIFEADGLLNEAMKILRDISRSIHPENISLLGWQQSFILELDRIRKTNVFSIAYASEGEPINIELSKQVIIFRILQESLNNIVKHSDGNHIAVQIRFEASQVTIRMEDDGKGIGEISKLREKQGSGVRNMQARAAMLPAVFGIENGEKQGTVITLTYKEPITKTA
jgi:signal transduction histidine kinase